MVDIPGICNCDELCTESVSCGCLLIHGVPGVPGCNCFCVDAAKNAKRHQRGVVQRISLDNQVSMDMRDASLGEVGKLIAESTDAQIFVPADRIDERRTMTMQEVSLETLVRELDLMAVVRP